MIFSKILPWVTFFAFCGAMIYAIYIVKEFVIYIVKEFKKELEIAKKYNAVYKSFIHHTEHQIFKWCRFRDLKFEPEELEKMLKETSDRLQKKLDRIDELEKRLEINTLK